MAYSYDTKGTKYLKNAGSWEKLAMWGSADNVEWDGTALSNLPASFGSATTVDGFLTEIDTYFGQANGFASLGGDGKVPAGQLPSAVGGGAMRFNGGQSLSGGYDIETWMNANIGATPTVDDEGLYFIVTVTGDLTNATGDSAHHQIQTGAGDEGDSTFPVTVEQGDWVVLLDVDTGTPLYTWGIINNDFKSATTAGLGAVQLSDASATTGLSGDHVITEGVMSSLISASDGFLLKTTAGWDSNAGFMVADGDGTFSFDTNTYLTSFDPLPVTLTGFSKAGSYSALTSSHTILSAFNQLAYTAETAYGWGDHASAGYQDAGSAIGINESNSTANSDSLILTFNYRDGSALAQTITAWAEGDDGKLWTGGTRNAMPIAHLQANATTPTTEGNDGDIWIVTS